MLPAQIIVPDGVSFGRLDDFAAIKEKEVARDLAVAGQNVRARSTNSSRPGWLNSFFDRKPGRPIHPPAGQ
ncbi:hypothetical protein HY573_02360 [Candidatus Parcubacteria bacterium]|nr:hypothetical protein [Candidatus Parcubacteria bacterium]